MILRDNYLAAAGHFPGHWEKETEKHGWERREGFREEGAEGIIDHTHMLFVVHFWLGA